MFIEGIYSAAVSRHEEYLTGCQYPQIKWRSSETGNLTCKQYLSGLMEEITSSTSYDVSLNMIVTSVF